jgi:uncharacterized OsmC-like protein
MKISARVINSFDSHQATVTTGNSSAEIAILPRASGFGSSANGGELLFLALATCYCNDIYREAEKTGLVVESVEVEVEGNFESEGEPASKVAYHARVAAAATEAEIHELMERVDSLAEIHNTLRVQTPVELARIEGVDTRR